MRVNGTLVQFAIATHHKRVDHNLSDARDGAVPFNLAMFEVGVRRPLNTLQLMHRAKHGCTRWTVPYLCLRASKARSTNV